MIQFRIYNKHLDQNLWNEQKELDPEVRTILLKIAKDYYEGNKEIEGALVDAYIVGSSANYNWTPDSDIDLHLVVDASKLDLEEETARSLFELMANKWNQNHAIKVKGHNLELYIQDINHNVRSSGIYSLTTGEWVKEPHPEKVEIDEENIKQKYRNMVARIDNAVQEQSVVKMKKVMEDLRNQRNTGLARAGEFSTENIVFKMLRRFGNIEKLKKATHQVYDREMTLTEGIKNPHDLIIGYVTPSLKVNAKDYSQIKGHTDFIDVKSWYGVTAWRFRRDLNLLFWWKPHTGEISQDERDTVVEFLEQKYKARNITQKFLVPGPGMNQDNWDISHGVKETLQQEEDGGRINPDDLIVGYIDKNMEIKSTSSRIAKTHGHFSGQYWNGQDRTIGWRFRKDLGVLYWWDGDPDDRSVSNADRLAVLDYLREKYHFTGPIQQKIITIGDNDTRDDKRRAHGVFEMADLQLKGKTPYAGEVRLKDLPIEAAKENIVVFRNDKETFFPAGFTLVYFMDSDQAVQAIKTGGIPYLMVPRGTFYSGGSPITDIWKKKFQKPGTEHIIGVLEGVSNDQEIFVDMLTVRPHWQRNHVATRMLNQLKTMFPNAQVKTSGQTATGEKFFSALKEEDTNPNRSFTWITGLTNDNLESVSEKYSGHINNVTHQKLQIKNSQKFPTGHTIAWRYVYDGDFINFWNSPSADQTEEIYSHLKQKYGITPKRNVIIPSHKHMFTPRTDEPLAELAV